MAKQTFTAGQVLTATQMNDLQTNDFNQTVSTKTAAYTFVVGDRGTRVVLNDTTARTFTINNSIFTAGDTIMVHNINTGVLTIAAGAGVTLNGADVLTLAQWQSGTIYFTSASSAIFFPTAKTVSAGGLAFLAGATFSTATSVSLPTNTFSATYRNYKLLFDITATTSLATVTGRVRAAGTDESGAVYSNMAMGIETNASANDVGNASQTSFNFGSSDGNNFHCL